MKRTILSILAVVLALNASAQRLENVKFGDFEHWTVRYIKQSDILGGATNELYVIGPTDTIRANKPYSYNKTIWSTSNAYAVVAGITKSTCSVMPDKGPHGTCAKLETKLFDCKVAGIINIKALAQGSIYWGKVLEPINGISKPYSHMDWGIPFTGRPKVLMLDYKALIPNTGQICKNNRMTSGYDPASIVLILQHRWEDSDGNIHARRVGTAAELISSSSNGWVFGHKLPVIYGDATKSSSYNSEMKLLLDERALYTRNSKGRNVPILEEWGSADDTVTHAVLSITSGSLGAFIGALGNTLWIDNIKLEY